MSIPDDQLFVCETGRLRMRGLCRDDIDGPYLGWFNDDEVCRYNSHGAFPATRDKLCAYVEDLQTSESRLVWAVIEKQSQSHIGNVTLQALDRRNQTAEFAIIMGDRGRWGKGYAYEASGAIISHGFRQLALRRVYCGTSENNHGMRRLAEKLGMREEGRRRKAVFENGAYVDVIEFGLLADEFDYDT